MCHFSFEGRLIYRGKWCLVEVPKDVINYYIKTIYSVWGIKLNSSYHGAHVTVVDGRREDASRHKLWGTNHGKKVLVEYSEIRNKSPYYTGEYWWLKVRNTQDFSNIRVMLGLPEKLFWDFHITIGYNNV